MGAIFYFYFPSSYEAKATLQMAQVANNSVETPILFLEKIKLPLFFQSTVGKACGVGEGIDSSLKVVAKINPVVNKVAPYISFTLKTKTTQEAYECLNAVVADIKIKQEELARPILETKKNELKTLREKLKLAEQESQALSAIKLSALFPNDQFAARALIMSRLFDNSREIKNLLETINQVELSLLEPYTKSSYLVSPVYVPEVNVNNRPVFVILICLMLGIFIGLVITGIKKTFPALSQKINAAKTVNPTNN
jgi:hypothetical protein